VALHLRRPLLVTGRAGSGKSSLIESVARELMLGPILRWHITSRSSLSEALYRYDAIGRLHAHNLDAQHGDPNASGIEDFLSLGPLGTALLPSSRPRALLIDEVDKSDIDLPNDLLNVFERGEFEIPELVRLAKRDHNTVRIRMDGTRESAPISRGRVRCQEFPFVVLTSNGERDFPPAFLRRCIRLRIPDPTPKLLASIVAAHLGPRAAAAGDKLITRFAAQAEGSAEYATDQLMNAIFVVTGDVAPDGAIRDRVVELVLKQLTADVG
jgi:MoxR-like ATPase